MVQRYSIRELQPEQIGIEIELRGSIVCPGQKNYFKLQEVNEAALMPMSIDCVYDGIIEPAYCSVIGTLQIDKRKYTNVFRPIFHVHTLNYITYFDSIELNQRSKETYFINENLSKLRFQQADLMIDFLNEHAMSEGFKLTHKKSKKENTITLRCHQHCFYGKNPELNSGCLFKITISKSKSESTYKVTSYNNTHDHLTNPSLYAHLVLKPKDKQLIQSLISANVKMTKILKIIKDQAHVSLSLDQLHNVCKSMRLKTVNSETQDVYDYVIEKKGYSSFLEYTKEGTIHRSAVATFSSIELDNLSQYGDFIAIDPTFSPLTTNWSIIPLTVVDSERKIRNAGVIFASCNQAKVFKWILELILCTLPCSSIIKTICSDDDLGLNGAFTLINESSAVEDADLKFKANSLGRVICFWHKSSNFVQFIQSLGFDTNTRNMLCDHFNLIGSSRDINVVELSIQHLCSFDTRIRQYLVDNIIPKLQFISKAYTGQIFTCGFYTSSIAESMNNRIKSQISARSMTLLEMRILIDEIIEQQETNKQYIKCRKQHKANDPLIIEMIATFNVGTRIAEALVGSFKKMERLKCNKNGDNYLVDDEIKNNEGKIIRTEKFIVIGDHCSCNKLEQTGLPCSHLFKIYQMEKKAIGSLPISKRWILNNDSVPSADDIQIKTLKTNFQYKDVQPSAQVISSSGRYLLILSKAHNLATVGSRTSKDFDYVMQTLEEAQQKIMNNETVVDDAGIRPGRKSSKRKGTK